jgi:bifunctional DNA-binding transcriptional regulator/antitoxin component of YhaV-PrlF toxin-antitoxin module
VSRVIEKGRVTVPKEVRERLGVDPGDEVSSEALLAFDAGFYRE